LDGQQPLGDRAAGRDQPVDRRRPGAYGAHAGGGKSDAAKERR
jgi:hypothetical protein